MGKYDDDDNYEKEEVNEKLIAKWVKNGASEDDAKQLIYDIDNDANSCDPDMDVFSDITINERIKKYGGGLTEDEMDKEED